MNLNIDRLRFCVGGSVFAHGLYWILRLVVSCSKRLYSFLAIVAAVVFMYRTWVDSIWPEIRVPPPEGEEDPEQWTPIHPQVLSVPELNRYFTDWTTSVKRWAQNVAALRKTHPGLFCILSSSTFAMTAVLGRMVSGVLILYSLLMAVTLGPGIALYVIPETWYEQIEALLRVASGKSPRETGSGDGGGNNATNPDDGLDEFLPEVDEGELSRQLSLSLESDFAPPSSRGLQAAVARELGTTHLASLEEETRLSEGLGSFPDFDEDSMDSFLPDMSTMPSLTDTLPPAPANNNENALANVINGIHFVASHFRQSSSDSEASEEAATIGADFGRRVTRSRGRPEASQSRPLAVGPPQRPSRHSSQGSDIDIDEYEVVDTRDLPST
ncbi:reticulophagy regulator 3 isoform X2 [Ixodes scapularis]|uniref:reticulophagy regulator 3 isoform X2 n=1 Tax=Ixodes scapularis TaxID=6945 RepID=UPI001A9EFB08|nr:reticulophagy regulator 3 isoform X2 [Ixodes scapularis]